MDQDGLKIALIKERRRWREGDGEEGEERGRDKECILPSATIHHESRLTNETLLIALL